LLRGALSWLRLARGGRGGGAAAGAAGVRRVVALASSLRVLSFRTARAGARRDSSRAGRWLKDEELAASGLRGAQRS